MPREDMELRPLPPLESPGPDQAATDEPGTERRPSPSPRESGCRPLVGEQTRSIEPKKRGTCSCIIYVRWLRNRCGVPDSRFQVALVLDAPSRIVDARCFQNRCGVLDTRCDVVSASRIVDARRFRNRCGVPDSRCEAFS